MTREEAIYWIKNLAVLSSEKDIANITEALDIAIEALEEETLQNLTKPNKSDLISRKDAIDALDERLRANGYSNVALVSELNRSIGYLMRLPSAQPEPKCGKWIVDRYCSECEWDKQEASYTSGWREKYCPNCGARMESDRK